MTKLAELANNRYSEQVVEGTFIFEGFLVTDRCKAYKGIMYVNNDHNDLIRLAIFTKGELNNIPTYSYIECKVSYNSKYDSYSTSSVMVKQDKAKIAWPANTPKEVEYPSEIKLDMTKCNLDIKGKTIEMVVQTQDGPRTKTLLNGQSTMNIFFNKIKNEFKPEMDNLKFVSKLADFSKVVNENEVNAIYKNVSTIQLTYNDEMSKLIKRQDLDKDSKKVLVGELITKTQKEVSDLQTDTNSKEIAYAAYKLSRKETSKKYSTFVTTICFDQFLELVETSKSFKSISEETDMDVLVKDLEETLKEIETKLNRREEIMADINESNIIELESLMKEIEKLILKKDQLTTKLETMV
jgi:hypothetical protein